MANFFYYLPSGQQVTSNSPKDVRDSLFLSFVDPTPTGPKGCFRWTGPNGTFLGKKPPVYMWEMTHGPIPLEGNGLYKLCVAHLCNRVGDPHCPNPAHLYLASRSINLQHAHRDGLVTYPAKGVSNNSPASLKRISEAVKALHAAGHYKHIYAIRKSPTRKPHTEETKAKMRETRLHNLAAQTPEERVQAAEISRTNGRKYTGETVDHAKASASQQARRARERASS